MHIKIISFHITETKCHICKVFDRERPSRSLSPTISLSLFPNPVLIRLLQPFRFIYLLRKQVAALSVNSPFICGLDKRKNVCMVNGGEMGLQQVSLIITLHCT